MKIINDIIEMKKQCGITERDATWDKQYEWYKYCLSAGLLEVEYKDDELLGYLEYVRLDKVPDDLENITLNYDTIKSAPVLFVSNCCVRGGNIRKLKQQLFEHNKGYTKLVWHRKSHNRFKIINRRNYGTSAQ